MVHVNGLPAQNGHAPSAVAHTYFATSQRDITVSNLFNASIGGLVFSVVWKMGPYSPSYSASFVGTVVGTIEFVAMEILSRYFLHEKTE